MSALTSTEGTRAAKLAIVASELRAIFDEDAERYDRARPGYPDVLFDDLCELAQLDAGSRVLEIGCGTGQATRRFAQRGMAIVAVELGANLAAVTRRNLAAFPDTRVTCRRTPACARWSPQRSTDCSRASVS